MVQNADHKHGINRIHIIISTLMLVTIGIAFIYKSYSAGIRETEQNALIMAKSVEAFFCSHVRNRQEGIEDNTSPESEYIKQGMIRISKFNENISYAYLYAIKDDRIELLMDSEQSDSIVQSLKKQKALETIELYKKPLIDGIPVIIKPAKGGNAGEISVITPVLELETGEVIAAFGMDYPAAKWYIEVFRRTAGSVILVVCAILLLVAFLLSLKKNRELSRLSKSLEKSEELFRTVIEQAPIGIAIGGNLNRPISVNKMYEKITGRSNEELTGMKWTEITHPDDLKEDISNFEKMKNGEIDSYSMNKRYIKPDGSYAWVNMVVAALQHKNLSEQAHVCLIEDITERKKIEQALLESERSKAVLLSHLPGMAYRCNCDRDWTMQFVSEGCYALTGYRPESLLNNRDLSYNDLIAPEYRDILFEEWERVLKVRGDFRYEYEIITASGAHKWVLELGQGIFNNNGEVEALEGIVIDITNQKKREAQIRYMSEHDFLTGLFNRSYFEKEMKRMDQDGLLPLSIIIGNIDGLKLINDAFGHLEGDRLIYEIAGIIRKCCSKQHIAARTAGDEFSILLPYTDGSTAYEIVNKIKDECERYNKTHNSSYNISISLGYGAKDTPFKDITDTVKEAEDYMHNRKLLNKKSSHNAILSSIMATMYIRSQETEEHAKRLYNISRKIGERLNLSQKDMDNLELFSMLHDIGKVGIDDSILNKPGKLTDEEWTKMKKHSEIGYRIAMSSSELEKIAEYILTHHERWDGKGYPSGLKGEEIPLLSRILAVADAYDAMTEDRVYRKAMSHYDAIDEIKRNAGTQFDPYIAKLFLEMDS